MRGEEAFTILYASLTAIFNAALVLEGVASIDEYISLNILSYFISYGLFMRTTRQTLAQKLVNALLLAIFFAIITYRVYQVIKT